MHVTSTFPRHGSREAAKTAKKAGLLRVFAPSRETILLPRRKESVVFPGKIAGICRCRLFPVAEPVTTANARIGPAILDGALPFAPAASSEKTACAQPPRG